ncbi:hypothetical protein HY991_04970 [Candidatus Micrarchaeota archaeon]|nr:hypothetical protein [Candidatus Micrarchaeota archaeon]
MEKGIDYKITKLEKGPLQRFKNQNLLIKKFGDVGVKVYKAITGKRTSSELVKDLEMEEEVFTPIMAYMEEAGMVELTPTGALLAKKEEATPVEEIKPIEKQKLPSRTAPPKPERMEEAEEKAKPFEEELEIKPEEKMPEEEFEIKPIEEKIKPVEERTKPEEEEKEPEFEKPAEEIKEETKPEEEEIRPIEEDKALPEEEKKLEEKKEFEIAPEEKVPEEEVSTEELSMKADEESGGEAREEGLSPVEKIIKDKYGETGIKVYNLIDGQKTAEEIMKETGLSESKLVEMLDFMDEEGIIKLEYPGEKKKPKVTEEKPPAAEGFTPMVEEEEIPEKEIIKNPIEVPIKAPLNMVEALYLRTKTLLRFGEKGGKALESIDGKKDIIEIAMENGLTLYGITDVINFLLEQKGILLKPLTRADVRKRYGDDGYSIYKKHGKDGVFLYELLDRDMKIKDMVRQLYPPADIAQNKEKMVDMFLFIRQILKIELPVDKELLYREFGV